MLSFDIRSLESQPAQVEGDLVATDPVWEEADGRPDAAVHVTGRLSAVGANRFYFSGRLEGALATECRRCLKAITVPVADDAHFFFAEAGADEADDPEVFLIDPRDAQLDLRPAVREQWLLAVPSWSLCREDCQGLCPQCGVDRNVTDCGHRPGATTDSRWDALKALKGQPES
ncbi:MAG: DUF177 domain-containing protein [Gemmatimonadetes bacterium]|nr:DUF177 domain-containing protein [Gemmatimonadota bacterium]